jgi:hypothetical protein
VKLRSLLFCVLASTVAPSPVIPSSPQASVGNLLAYGAALARADASGAADPVIDVAILGDSLSTGAATHPALRFDTRDLWAVFNGERSVAPSASDLPSDFRAVVPATLAPPGRLWPSAREFLGGPDWVWRNALGSLSRVFLDTEQYSWGYLVASGLAVPPERVAIAGEDGARVAAIPRQVDRLLDATGGRLPRRIFLLYTGNDLCGQTLEATTSPKDFATGLETGLRYALRNGTASAPEGTDVYVLSYLGVLQLLHDEAILAKKVYAHGKEVSCKELREQAFEAAARVEGAAAPATGASAPPAWFTWFMPPNPSAFCPTLFGGLDGVPGRTSDEVIGALANRIRAFRDEEERVVARLAEVAAKEGAPVRLHYLKSSGLVAFAPEDIAGDCFHLSASGQGKVARAALTDLGRPLAPP